MPNMYNIVSFMQKFGCIPQNKRKYILLYISPPSDRKKMKHSSLDSS